MNLFYEEAQGHREIFLYHLYINNSSDISGINGNNYGKASLLETFEDIEHEGKSKLSINALALMKYDGKIKAYSIASLAFSLYHEFYHVNVIAGRFGLKKIGSVEKANINPQEEFLASYYASKAALPLDPVMQNYYYSRSVSVVNNIIYYSNELEKYINQYMDKIKELLRSVDNEHQLETIELIKKSTGIMKNKRKEVHTKRN